MVNGSANGKNGSWTLVLPVGALTLLGALLLTVQNDATVALKLIAQGKQEFTILHGEIQGLKSALNVRTLQRYTSKDAERDFKYIQREIDQCNDFIKNHGKVKHVRAD
jgi:hypothetical protein